MKMKVKAIPVQEVVKDIARQWNVPIKDDGGELTIEVPEKLGKGFIRCANFASGIGMIEYQCCFFQHFEFVFTINQTHPLKFIFCSDGIAEHRFAEDQQTNTIETYQNVIVSSSGNNGHVLVFKKNQPAHVVSIEIIRNIFSKRNNHHFKGLEPELKELFEDSVAEKKFFYQGNYSIKAADIVEEITHKDYGGFIRTIFLEGKLFEMLVIQIKQYQDDHREDKLPQILRRSDVVKVERAVEIINEQMDQNLSIEQLAKDVGTNMNKLQEGFKYMFDLTVNKYMQQVKLERAKELLLKQEHNISEIVSLIGLNNRSYFSKVFKEKYGVSPKYFRKTSNQNDSEGEEEE